MLWVTFGLIAVLGGADDLVPQPDLHQVEAERRSTGRWRSALWISQAVFGKNLLQVLVGEQLELPKRRVAAAEPRLDRVLRR